MVVMRLRAPIGPPGRVGATLVWREAERHRSSRAASVPGSGSTFVVSVRPHSNRDTGHPRRTRGRPSSSSVRRPCFLQVVARIGRAICRCRRSHCPDVRTTLIQRPRREPRIAVPTRRCAAPAATACSEVGAHSRGDDGGRRIEPSQVPERSPRDRRRSERGRTQRRHGHDATQAQRAEFSTASARPGTPSRGTPPRAGITIQADLDEDRRSRHSMPLRPAQGAMSVRRSRECTIVANRPAWTVFIGLDVRMRCSLVPRHRHPTSRGLLDTVPRHRQRPAQPDAGCRPPGGSW